MIPRPGKRWPRRSSQPKTIEKRPGTTPLSGSLSVPGESASWAGMMNAKQVAGIRQPLPAFVESFASELERSASGRSDALRWICSISSSRSCRPIARSCSMPATVVCCRCWRSWSSGASRMSPRFPALWRLGPPRRWRRWRVRPRAVPPSTPGSAPRGCSRGRRRWAQTGYVGDLRSQTKDGKVLPAFLFPL